MGEEVNLTIALDSLAKARNYFQEKNYGRAFAHYLVVFQLLDPVVRKQYEKEFTTVLQLWGSILHQRGKYKDVFRCYHMATLYFPTSVEILNNLGIHALKLKCFSAAKVYFENALAFNSNFLPAEQNLQSTNYALVERWHFPMLNDLTRNKAYAQAIFMEISHGFTNILDVGTGTGILSLFASKSKQCKSITACDYSDTMFEIAKRVLQANNVTNVKLIKKVSTNLEIPDDLKKRVTLLVTEILDCGVFGECILETLIHAWDYLLTPYPYGRVIPAGVTLYVVGINSSEVARKHRLLLRDNNILNLNSVQINYKSELYDSENLRTMKVKYITEVGVGLSISFNNVVQLKTIMTTANYNPEITLKCVTPGEIDAFAVWFKLHLNDSIYLTSDPNVPTTSCWEQAIVNLSYPLPVVQNKEIKVKLSCVDGYLELFCRNIESRNNIFYVSKKIITFLNDFVYMDLIEEVSVKLLEKFQGKPQFSVMDITPFPVLGLILMKAGAVLTCRVKDENFEQLVRHVCKLNNINEQNITFINAKDFIDFTSTDIEFDMIFQNIVSPSGLLTEIELYQVDVMKYSLAPQGIYLPHAITVWAQLVECDWLNQATKVNDKNVCGFKIAQFINEYKSSEQRDLNFNAVEHTNLSEPVKLDVIKHDISKTFLSKVQVPAIGNGVANAVFYWFEIEVLEGMSLSTRRDKCFVNNAAFVFDRSMNVKKNDIITLALKQHSGILKIFISEPD